MIPRRRPLKTLPCLLLVLLLAAALASPAAAKRVVVVTYDVSGSMVPKVKPNRNQKSTWRYTMNPQQLKAVAGAVADLVADGWPNLEGMQGSFGSLFDEPELGKGAQAPLWRQGDGLVLFTYGQGVVKKYDSRLGGQGLSDPGQVRQILMQNLPYPRVPGELANEYSYIRLKPYYTQAFPGALTLRDAARLEVYRIYEELYRNHRKGQPLPEVIWVDISDREVDPGSKQTQIAHLREYERFAFRLEASLGLTDFPLYQVTANNRMYIIARRVSQTSDISEEKKQELERLRQEIAKFQEKIKIIIAQFQEKIEILKQEKAEALNAELKKTASRLILRVKGQIVKEIKMQDGGVRGEDALRLERRAAPERKPQKGDAPVKSKQYLFVLSDLKLEPPAEVSAEDLQIKKLVLRLHDQRGAVVGVEGVGPVVFEDKQVNPADPRVGKVFAFAVLLNKEQAAFVSGAEVEARFLLAGQGVPVNAEAATDGDSLVRQRPFVKRWNFNTSLELPTSLWLYTLVGFMVLLLVGGALYVGFGKRRGREEIEELGPLPEEPREEDEFGEDGWPSELGEENNWRAGSDGGTAPVAVPGAGGVAGMGASLLVQAEGGSRWVLASGGSLNLRYNDLYETLEACDPDQAFWNLTWDGSRLTLGESEIPHDRPFELWIDDDSDDLGGSGSSVTLTFAIQ